MTTPPANPKGDERPATLRDLYRLLAIFGAIATAVLSAGFTTVVIVAENKAHAVFDSKITDHSLRPHAGAALASDVESRLDGLATKDSVRVVEAKVDGLNQRLDDVLEMWRAENDK